MPIPTIVALPSWAKKELARIVSPRWRELSQHDRLAILEKFFVINLCDDPVEGSNFDVDVIHCLEALKQRHLGEG